MARERKTQPRSKYGSRPLKRVVVKEEFVALTGDHEKALILAQLEYWHARPQEIDKYLHEELDRAHRSGADVTHTIQPTEGWIYKEAEELIGETMLSVSRQTMRRRLKDLVDSGWVLQRNNPHHTWDQTLQYRLDLLKIRDDLRKIGYELQGWVLDVEEETGPDEDSEDSEPGGEPESGAEGNAAMSSLDIAESSLDIGTSRMVFRMSSLDNQMLNDGPAIPETTSEITTEWDLPSVDPSACAAPARESSPAHDQAGPNDRLTDRPTDEEEQDPACEASTTTPLLEGSEPHQEDSETLDLSPKEGEDNAASKPEDALRKQVEAIPTSEVSEEARHLTGELLLELPTLSERDQLRTARLAEHYHRRQRTSFLRTAASGVALYAAQQQIRHPFSYLLVCCVDAEGEHCEGDEELLASLSGEHTSSPPGEKQPARYEWFFSESEKESDAGESQQRQQSPNADPDALEVWEKVLEDVSGEINAPSLRVWFEGTVPISLSGDTLTVSVPNTFAKDYIESRFKELLEGALSKRLSPTSQASPRLEIVVGVEGSTNNTSKKGNTSQDEERG